MITIKKNIKKFVGLTNIISSVSEETNYEFSKDGLFIRFAHPSGFTLGLVKLKIDFFDEYKIKEDIVICINNEMFNKIIKKLAKKEIQIEINNNGSEIKCISGKSSFELKTYSIPADERPVPTPEYDSIWDINTLDFFTLITEHKEFSDVACFETKGNELKTVIKSNMISGEIFTTAKPIKQNDIKAYYDIGMLSMILCIKDYFENVIFSFGADAPCNIKYNDNEINFEWFLAPRINNDE